MITEINLAAYRSEAITPERKNSSSFHSNQESSLDLEEMSAYSRDIGPVSLLSAEEEIELGKMIKAGQKARRQMVIQGFKKNQAELRYLAKAGFEAEDELIQRNLPLVISIAKEYNSTFSRLSSRRQSKSHQSSQNI